MQSQQQQQQQLQHSGPGACNSSAAGSMLGTRSAGRDPGCRSGGDGSSSSAVRRVVLHVDCDAFYTQVGHQKVH
jgi:hypothetical protein